MIKLIEAKQRSRTLDIATYNSMSTALSTPQTFVEFILYQGPTIILNYISYIVAGNRMVCFSLKVFFLT